MPPKSKQSPKKSDSDMMYILMEQMIRMDVDMKRMAKEHEMLLAKMDELNAFVNDQIKQELDSQLQRVEQLESAAQQSITAKISPPAKPLTVGGRKRRQ